MGEHIQKEVTKGLLRQGIKQNKPYFKEVIIFSIIGLILLVGYFINSSPKRDYFSYKTRG